MSVFAMQPVCAYFARRGVAYTYVAPSDPQAPPDAVLLPDGSRLDYREVRDRLIYRWLRPTGARVFFVSWDAAEIMFETYSLFLTTGGVS